MTEHFDGVKPDDG